MVSGLKIYTLDLIMHAISTLDFEQMEKDKHEKFNGIDPFDIEFEEDQEKFLKKTFNSPFDAPFSELGNLNPEQEEELLNVEEQTEYISFDPHNPNFPTHKLGTEIPVDDPDLQNNPYFMTSFYNSPVTNEYESEEYLKENPFLPNFGKLENPSSDLKQNLSPEISALIDQFESSFQSFGQS